MAATKPKTATANAKQQAFQGIINIEKGDLFRALGRYNGSLGKPEYPNMVRAAWQNQWGYEKAGRLAQVGN